MVIAPLSSSADAHFLLVSPAASLVQNRLGDPRKIAPCGGVSANPTRGTLANPGLASNAVTKLTGGSSVHLLVHETVLIVTGPRQMQLGLRVGFPLLATRPG